MPNTLVHFGVQGITSRTVFRDIDIKWVFLACVIPDIPWILQRVLKLVVPGTDPYTLRLYAIVQATFMFSLVLCMAIASISERPRVIFSVLAINSLLHLILDACETKWGNGVHLFAPFSWQLSNFGLVWPESMSIRLLTILGLIYSIWVIRYAPGRSVNVYFGHPRRIVIALLLLGVYFLAPFLLMHGPDDTYNHSVKTLREKAERTGKQVSMDRNYFTKDESGDVVRTFAGEHVRVVGNLPDRSGAVSMRGIFIDTETIQIRDFYMHTPAFRDVPTYIGLALLLVIWVSGLVKGNRRPTGKPGDSGFKRDRP